MDNKILFEPYTFNNGVKVGSRLAVAPLTLFSSNPDGAVSSAEEKFLSTRAEHIGLYIQGATMVSTNGQVFPCQPRAVSDSDLAALRKRAEIIKKQGALSIVQLHHGGELSVPALTGEPALGPSSKEGVRELTDEQIEKIIKDFAKATELCIKSGNDGIEIHGANQFVLQQFFSKKINHRTDKWGGNLENRLRFPMAVVDAIDAVRVKMNRPDFIVGYRLSPEEPGENGLTMTDTVDLLKALMEKNIQYLHVSQWNFDKKARRGIGEGTPRLKIIHDILKGTIPLIGVGSLFSMEDFIEAKKTGYAEFVGCGKSIMMNPHLGTKLFECKAEEIVTELDLDKDDHYDIPEPLWNMCKNGEDWLPPVKGLESKGSAFSSVTQY